jgi:23S rRNA A1618 N6-methylase RlmF
MKALIEKTEKNIFTIAVSRNSTTPALLKEFQQLWQVPCFSQHITEHQKSIQFVAELHIQDNHNSKLEYQEVKRLLKQATITI